VDAYQELLARFKKPLVEVCGGMAVSLATLGAWASGS
jgi:L-serine/L-threonine ammonia-lyase